MPCISAMDFMKVKIPTLSLAAQIGVNKLEKKEFMPLSSEDSQLDHQNTILNESSEDSNLTLDLFKRYHPLVRLSFDNGQRKPSMLERVLLPGFSSEPPTPTSSAEKGFKAQLTIFYGGEIIVYNDVPYEKAQAIMFLAGRESSLSAPIVTNTDVKKPLHNNPPNISSLGNLQADLPIARKYSLKRFLEKRRGRITSKSPYCSPETKHNEVNGDDQTAKDDTNTREKLQKAPLVLSPFPSRLGNFTPSK